MRKRKSLSSRSLRKRSNGTVDSQGSTPDPPIPPTAKLATGRSTTGTTTLGILFSRLTAPKVTTSTSTSRCSRRPRNGPQLPMISSCRTLTLALFFSLLKRSNSRPAKTQGTVATPTAPSDLASQAAKPKVAGWDLLVTEDPTLELSPWAHCDHEGLTLSTPAQTTTILSAGRCNPDSSH